MILRALLLEQLALELEGMLFLLTAAQHTDLIALDIASWAGLNSGFTLINSNSIARIGPLDAAYLFLPT